MSVFKSTERVPPTMIRLALCKSRDTIEEAAKRIRECKVFDEAFRP
jgi:hypothetical protein